ncbi:MAG TPA: hypothetical protein VF170_20225, partial [Planctomycetaceae bacterium]
MSLRCVAASALLLAVLPLGAAEDPLDAFPADTGVVLRLGPPAEVTAKVKAFLNAAAPQFAAVADQLPPGLGSLFGNPTLAGVDAGRDWYLGVMPRPERRPAVVFAVPAADAAALKKAVGEGYTFADAEDWVLYSLDAEAMAKVQGRVGGDGASVREAMTESLRTVFGAGEAAAFLNVSPLRETYRAQIDRAKEQFLENAARATPGAEADPAAKAGLEYNRKALEALLKAVDDTNGVATRLMIGEAALDSEAVVVVKPGSPSAELLAKQTTSDFPLLAKLPGGRLVYYGLAGDFSDLMEASAGLSAGVLPQSEEFQKLLAEARELRF